MARLAWLVLTLTPPLFPQVTIAVGLAGFACILLLALFVLINKYGRRSKFGMKGKSADCQTGATPQMQLTLTVAVLPFRPLRHGVDRLPPS